jgi:hypothetical protein
VSDPAPGLLERFASRYFQLEPGALAPGSASAGVADLYDLRLSPVQIQGLRRLVITTLAMAGAAGALGVLLLHGPRLLVPDLVGRGTVALPLGGHRLEVPVPFTVYGLVLALAEIYLLVFLNVRSVGYMARLCGFPSPADPERAAHLRALVGISIEKDARNELRLGLNPWQGYSRARLAVLFVWTRAKATLSNVVVKMLLRRMLGRYAIRLFVDFVGIPVMAAWNVYASWRVLTEARVRILAPALVQHCVRHFHRRHGEDPAFVALLYDLLQYVAVQKRAFNENHYLLSEALLRAFAVPLRPRHEVGDDFLSRLRALGPEARGDLVRLLVVGMIIDGQLSRAERRALRRLREAGLPAPSVPEVRRIVRSFVRGCGLTVLEHELELAG